LKTHYCPAEKEVITFEGTCNWCDDREWVGLDEHDFDVLFLNEDGIRFAKYIEAKLREKND